MINIHCELSEIILLIMIMYCYVIVDKNIQVSIRMVDKHIKANRNISDGY